MNQERLTHNFWLDELTRSETAVRLGVANDPSEEEKQNLKRLCRSVLQPLREKTGHTIIVLSGFRCLEVNRAIGSKDTSQHLKGLAADIRSTHQQLRDAFAFARYIADRKLDWDQLINEYDEWVHISVPEEGKPARRMLLTIDHQGTREGILTARPRLPDAPPVGG